MGGGGIAVEAARPAPGVPVPGCNRLVRCCSGPVWKLSQAGGIALFVPGILLPAGVRHLAGEVPGAADAGAFWVVAGSQPGALRIL